MENIIQEIILDFKKSALCAAWILSGAFFGGLFLRFLPGGLAFALMLILWAASGIGAIFLYKKWTAPKEPSASDAEQAYTTATPEQAPKSVADTACTAQNPTQNPDIEKQNEGLIKAKETKLSPAEVSVQKPENAEDAIDCTNKNDAVLTDKSEEKLCCLCCNAKIENDQILYAYGSGVCQTCYENFQKIEEAILLNIDPYLFVKEEQKAPRNRLARGLLVDDVTFVKSKMQKERFEELYYRVDNNKNNCFLFHYDDDDGETRIYFNKDYGIPYFQFWRFLSHEGRPGSVYQSMKFIISFFELELLAQKVSKELYDKYKGINEYNWQEYIRGGINDEQEN